MYKEITDFIDSALCKSNSKTMIQKTLTNIKKLLSNFFSCKIHGDLKPVNTAEKRNLYLK